MCFDTLRKNRVWAIFAAGMLFATALSSIGLVLSGVEIDISGIHFGKELIALRAAIALLLSYAFLLFASKAGKKRR